jgi:hypothetical protein
MSTDAERLCSLIAFPTKAYKPVHALVADHWCDSNGYMFVVVDEQLKRPTSLGTKGRAREQAWIFRTLMISACISELQQWRLRWRMKRAGGAATDRAEVVVAGGEGSALTGGCASRDAINDDRCAYGAGTGGRTLVQLLQLAQSSS